MGLKQQLQQLKNRLDKYLHTLEAAELRNDIALVAQSKSEIELIKAKIAKLTVEQDQQLSSKAQDIKALAFNRALTKIEQADLGKLKKTVRGLVVVHPLTALGRELELKVMTGYARKTF